MIYMEFYSLFCCFIYFVDLEHNVTRLVIYSKFISITNCWYISEDQSNYYYFYCLDPSQLSSSFSS